MRYLTKEWYIACQADPMTPEVQKQLDEIDRAYCAAQTRETLPDGLLQQFFFHDGVVREIITGTDLTLCIDSPYSEYHTVTFRGARLKQEPPRVGAVWLYREQDDGHKNTELCRAAEQQHFRIGKQGAEIDHSADSHKQQQRERLRGADPHVVKPLDNAVVPQHAGIRQVYQDGAEAHREQQGRLVILFNGEPDQKTADEPHHNHRPGDILHTVD